MTISQKIIKRIISDNDFSLRMAIHSKKLLSIYTPTIATKGLNIITNSFFINFWTTDQPRRGAVAF